MHNFRFLEIKLVNVFLENLVSRTSTKPAAAGLLFLVFPPWILSETSNVSARLFARVRFFILMFPSWSQVACLTAGELTDTWLLWLR